MGRIKSIPGRALPLAIAMLVCQQAQAADIFGGSISANSLMSDNSTKTALDPIDERQDVYQLNLTANYDNWLIDLDADYQLYAQTFAKETQSDDEYVDGSTALVFGKDRDPFGLELHHSSRMLLQTPDAIDLLENMDEREIISAAPIARLRLFDTDILFVRGDFSQVSFKESETQDSKRNGASLGWIHPLSVTDVLQLTAQQSEVKFDHRPESDYTLTNAMLSYAVQLRKLNYRIEVGYNETSPEVGEEQGSPTYRAELGYISGYNNFSLSFSQQITDTSFGDGNAYDPSEIPGGDGLSQELDLIDRQKADVNWTTTAICDRCSFSIGVGLEDDDYLMSDEESRNLYARSAFIYSLSKAARIEFTANRSKYDFEGTGVMTDYDVNYFSLKYAYRFVNGIDVDVFARREDRESDAPNSSYDENIYGIGLGYFF